MKREVIRVEPLSTFLERRRTPTSVVIRHGETVYVSGLPPFDETGEIVSAPLERQTEIVLEQLKRCLEAAGSSLEKVLRCTVYCTSADAFAKKPARSICFAPRSRPPPSPARPKSKPCASPCGRKASSAGRRWAP